LSLSNIKILEQCLISLLANSGIKKGEAEVYASAYVDPMSSKLYVNYKVSRQGHVYSNEAIYPSSIKLSDAIESSKEDIQSIELALNTPQEDLPLFMGEERILVKEISLWRLENGI